MGERRAESKSSVHAMLDFVLVCGHLAVLRCHPRLSSTVLHDHDMTVKVWDDAIDLRRGVTGVTVTARFLIYSRIRVGKRLDRVP